MSITQEQLQFIISSDVEQLVGRLQEEQGLSLDEAFSRVYGSGTYRKLLNTGTGLFLQSPDYIYDYLIEENTNP